MKTFLIAGFLYMVGIAVVLLLKPSFMFTPNGDWKEFGIGRSPASHTWLPLWLFAILWAMVSYIIAILIVSLVYKSSNTISPISTFSTMSAITPVNNVVQQVNRGDLVPEVIKRSKKSELVPGYYMLNSAATEAAGGIPKYVYLGDSI
jgi:hypothetical protein